MSEEDTVSRPDPAELADRAVAYVFENELANLRTTAKAARWLTNIWAGSTSIEAGSALAEDIERLRAALEGAPMTQSERHRPEWLNDAPTGFCECGLTSGHPMTPSDPTRLRGAVRDLCDFAGRYIAGDSDILPEDVHASIEEARDALAALPTTPTPSRQENDMEDEKTAATPDQDALDYAWTIIANAGGGDWTREAQDWQDAAARFRDQYHATLDARRSTP